jgi:peptidoglycan DL-endopeptidase CwlO
LGGWVRHRMRSAAAGCARGRMRSAAAGYPRGRMRHRQHPWLRRWLPVAAIGLTVPAIIAAGTSLPREPVGSGGVTAPAGAAGRESPGGSGRASRGVSVASLTSFPARPAIAPLRRLSVADLLVVAAAPLPGGALRSVRRLRGVTAAQRLDAATVRVNGTFVAMLGVDPAAFRSFAARPTAKSAGLWENVADGGIAVSYQMGTQDRLPLGGAVRVTGRRTERLRVAGYGTVGISGVDAVVSAAVARSLGMPTGNAIVVSAPHARLAGLIKRIKSVLPRRAAIAPLVAQSASAGTAAPGGSGAGLIRGSGAAGAVGITAADGLGLSRAQVVAFLKAAESRLGMPYVWGAAGPRAFDCSGLVQWSLARAGVVMPRVAVDQARTGPQLPLSRLQPGDLLFYHTDPTAPSYISHVAIYIGDGEMIQAPAPGLDVEVVPALFGPGFAGAVQVYPKVAAAVAADPAG